MESKPIMKVHVKDGNEGSKQKLCSSEETDSNRTITFTSGTESVRSERSASVGSSEIQYVHIVSGVPVGLKIIAVISMVTAITLTIASATLLYRSNQVLVAWLKVAPTSLNLISEVNNLFGGTADVVAQVAAQEQYLRVLVICSAVLIATGVIQLVCNIWYFCRMNSACITKKLIWTEQFCCGN